MRDRLKDKIVRFIVDYVTIPLCMGGWVFVCHYAHFDVWLTIFLAMTLGMISSVFIGYLILVFFHVKPKR